MKIRFTFRKINFFFRAVTFLGSNDTVNLNTIETHTIQSEVKEFDGLLFFDK